MTFAQTPMRCSPRSRRRRVKARVASSRSFSAWRQAWAKPTRCSNPRSDRRPKAPTSSSAMSKITGSTMHETIPDSVLDIAEIELIDISPQDLLKRLDEGKVYLPDRAAVAMMNFFREGNLTALREIALRLAAERVGQDVRDYMKA